MGPEKPEQRHDDRHGAPDGILEEKGRRKGTWIKYGLQFKIMYQDVLTNCNNSVENRKEKKIEVK